MTSKYDHLASTKYLSNLCKDGTPFRGRIAQLSFHNQASAKQIDKILLLIEYGQLLTLLLRVNYKFYPAVASNTLDLNNLVSVFAIVFSPGNLLPLEKDHLGLIRGVLDMCFAFYLFRIVLFVYVIWLAFKRRESSGILIRIWQSIFHIQTKALHYNFASVYVNVYDAAFKNSLGLDNNTRHAFMAVCVIMILLEFSFSFILTSQLTNILPYKRFSAAKDNFSELTVLIQKLSNSLVKRIFSLPSSATIWVYALMNAVFGFLTVYHLLRKIQIYNYKSLKLQMYLVCSVFSLGIAGLAQVFLSSKKVNMNFVIIIWVILSIFCTKFASAFLEKKLWTLAFEKGINKTRSPEELVHKIIVIKQILKQNKFPTNTSGSYDLYHLLSSTLNQTTLSNFDLNLTNVECKATRNKIFMHYLEEVRTQFPKNNFIKLYTAYHYARKMKLYGLSIKTLAEIKTSLYPTVVVSKSLLKNFIQSQIRSGYQQGEYTFNLYDSFKNLACLSKLKLHMAKQAKLQWDLCNQITNVGEPDLAKILRLGNKANALQRKIQKRYRKMAEQIPEYYITPSLLYGYYNLFLRYSSEEYQKCQESYTKRSQKYQKLFEDDKLSPENIVQDDSFLTIFSGEKENAGKVIHVSPALEQILERKFSGGPVTALTPPFMRARSSSIVEYLMGHNALALLNTQNTQFFYHLKGYMIPINYYLSINPSIYGGISFVIVLRIAKNSGKQFILLNEEGGIESFTKSIGDSLGLFSKDGFYLTDKKTEMAQICPEFSSVNHAFNVMTFPSRYQNKYKLSETHHLEEEEAKRLYTLYSEQGENITLTPLNKNIKLTYSCLVKPLIAGNKAGKILTLEKILHIEDEIHQERDPLTAPNNKHLLDVSEISSIDEQEDKGLAWTDFERLKSENNPRQLTTLTSPNDPHLSTDRNLLTSKSPRPHHLITGKRQIVSIQTKERESSFHGGSAEKPHYKPHWLAKTNPKSMKVYQQALEEPYSPVFYKTFTTALYALFLTMIIMYLSSSINMHQGISDLRVSKQILRMAEARNNYLGTLDGGARFLWTYATQSSNLTAFLSNSVVQIASLLQITQSTASGLETANNDLFELTSSLNTQDRDWLFDRDIRVFDTNATSTLGTYINLTSFQATDKIVGTTFEAVNTYNQSLQQAVPYLTAILRNAMNDMLVKNAAISESFKASFNSKKDDFTTWITNFFVISLCLILLAVFGFLYILYLQARRESENTSALIRLKPEAIRPLKQDFLAFRDIIFDNNQGLLSQENSATDPFYSQSVGRPTQKTSDAAKQNHQGNPIYKGLWLEYYLYLLKLILLFFVLIGLFMANFILFKKYLNQLSDKAYQIHFIEQMNSRLGVLSGSFLELISENDTTVILNIQASESLAIQISNISEMFQSVSDDLGFAVSKDNELIQDLLYGDSCSYLTEYEIVWDFCQQLANYQEKTGFINLLNNFELSINNIYSRFMDGDRQQDTLLNLEIEAFNKINLPVFMVIQAENAMIAETLNQDFEEIVSQSQSLNITINVVILVLILVECFMIHFVIINKLKRKEMQFKRILGLFPANIILPNLILKSYITKTSNQTFNSFRD